MHSQGTLRIPEAASQGMELHAGSALALLPSPGGPLGGVLHDLIIPGSRDGDRLIKGDAGFGDSANDEPVHRVLVPVEANLHLGSATVSCKVLRA